MLYLAPPFGWCGPDREQRERERFDRTGHRGPAATTRQHQARSAGTSTETPVVDLKRAAPGPLAGARLDSATTEFFYARAALAAWRLPASREAVPPCFPIGDRYGRGSDGYHCDYHIANPRRRRHGTNGPGGYRAPVRIHRRRRYRHQG